MGRLWMKKKRFSVEQIVGVLNQAQVSVPVAEVPSVGQKLRKWFGAGRMSI
jgi:hypothetical protein